MKVEERPVSVPDLLATVCLALGIDPTTQNLSNVGRPIRIADPGAKPITVMGLQPAEAAPLQWQWRKRSPRASAHASLVG